MPPAVGEALHRVHQEIKARTHWLRHAMLGIEVENHCDVAGESALKVPALHCGTVARRAVSERTFRVLSQTNAVPDGHSPTCNFLHMVCKGGPIRSLSQFPSSLSYSSGSHFHFL